MHKIVSPIGFECLEYTILFLSFYVSLDALYCCQEIGFVVNKRKDPIGHGESKTSRHEDFSASSIHEYLRQIGLDVMLDPKLPPPTLHVETFDGSEAKSVGLLQYYYTAKKAMWEQKMDLSMNIQHRSTSMRVI